MLSVADDAVDAEIFIRELDGLDRGLAAGGVEAAYRRALAESDDPDRLRAELLERFAEVRSPFRTAEAFDIEEIIDPRETRPLLCEWIALAYRSMDPKPGPKARGHRP